MKKVVSLLKEVLKELSVMPIFSLFLAVLVGLGLCLPQSFLKQLPFEVFCILAAVAILAMLYTMAGIVTVMQKLRKQRKDKDGKG